MLNVSLRRPPLHTCSSNKDPLSHIYFPQWILSHFDSQQGVTFFSFFFRFMYTSKLQTQDSCFLSFELVILLFKSLLILFFPNYNGLNANEAIINTSRERVQARISILESSRFNPQTPSLDGNTNISPRFRDTECLFKLRR